MEKHDPISSFRALKLKRHECFGYKFKMVSRLHNTACVRDWIPLIRKLLVLAGNGSGLAKHKDTCRVGQNCISALYYAV